MLHTLLHLGHATQPVGYHSTRFSREDFLLETDRVCCILSSLADLPDRLSCLILETLMGKVAGPVPRGRTPAKKCTESGKSLLSYCGMHNCRILYWSRIWPYIWFCGSWKLYEAIDMTLVEWGLIDYYCYEAIDGLNMIVKWILRIFSGVSGL